jgi:hypothetical protein
MVVAIGGDCSVLRLLDLLEGLLLQRSTGPANSPLLFFFFLDLFLHHLDKVATTLGLFMERGVFTVPTPITFLLVFCV